MRIKCIEHNKTQITLTARNEAVSKRKNTSQTATSVRVFYSKHENKMYREPIPVAAHQIQFRMESEPAVSSIYKQNPLKKLKPWKPLLLC
ncbi:MAG: hypothetical protein CMO82_11895 [Winogradskyella sp.]|nr:hypothetical protein [Winogradskyella sp.]